MPVDTGPIALAAGFARLAAEGTAEITHPTGGIDVRLVRAPGGAEGRWDAHDDGPETVVVWSGTFVVEFADGALTLGPGEVCVVPARARHRGSSPDGAEVMLLRQRSS